MPAGGKDKGTGRYGGRQSGMGRLRRANIKQAGRMGSWESRVEDDDFLSRHESERQRVSHAGHQKFHR